MEDLRRLLDMVSKAPSEVGEEESEQLAAVIEALVKRIVML